MDGQNYLNQISSSVRPEKKSSGFLKSPFLIAIVGGIVAIIAVMIIGSAIGGGGGVKEKSVALKFHIDDTLEVIDEYQDSVKSSDLRSSSASLASVLSNTGRELTNYLADTYNYKDGASEYKNLSEEAKLEQDSLMADLFEAKISGTLDRIYAHKMAYEIDRLKVEEAEIYNSTSNDTLKSLLSTSYNSLDNLYSNFDDFSIAK